MTSNSSSELRAATALSSEPASRDMTDEPAARVAVVGACAAGKSTLVAALLQAGYEARHVAQEHSYVPSMWKQICRPDLLIYLDVDYETISVRRPTLRFRPRDLEEQRHRLAHARQHCDLYLDTNNLSPGEIQLRALAFLEGALAADLAL